MKNILALVILLLVALACGTQTEVDTGTKTTNDTGTNKSTETAEIGKTIEKTAPNEYSTLQIARATIGFDDGSLPKDDGSLPKEDDLRIKRAAFLIDSLADRANEKPNFIAYQIDKNVAVLRDMYGRDITRLGLLEEIKSYYDQNPRNSMNFQDTLKTYAALKYAK